MHASQEAAKAGAKLVVLPEMWNCPYSNESFPKYAEDIAAGHSQSVSAMSNSAKEHKITLVAGSIPESSDGKLYNTCCIFDDAGNLLGKHRKVCSVNFANTLLAFRPCRKILSHVVCSLCTNAQ